MVTSQISILVLCVLVGVLFHKWGNHLKANGTQYLLDLRDKVILIPMLFVITFVLIAPPTNPYDIVLPCLSYALYFVLSNVLMYFVIKYKHSNLTTES